MNVEQVPPRPHVALVTSSSLTETPIEDLLLQGALICFDAAVRIVPWDDPDVDWRDFDAVIIRSTWDYHHRLEAFLSWVGGLERDGIAVWNRPAHIRWNAHKGYLIELQKQDVATVPTCWVSKGEWVDLFQLLKDQGWEDAIVKPAVSASAHRTYRIGAGETGRMQDELRISAKDDLLVQPFLAEIGSGELSFIFIAGEFSHAVIKFARAGDFRVQRQFGGWEEPFDPPPHFVEQARSILATAVYDPLYARVDALPINDQLVLMELELIEPALFLSLGHGAAERLARAIIARTERSRRLRKGLKRERRVSMRNENEY